MHRSGTLNRTGTAPGGEPTDDAPGDRRPTAPEAQRLLRTAGRALLVLYPLLLTWLVLRPNAAGWTYPANLTPLASVDRAFTSGGLAGARQIASAALPMAPFGVLLPLAVGRPDTPWLPSFLRTAGGSALLATGLEILKSWAPGHVLNVDDIILGTLGAALCHLAVVPAGRTLLRLRARSPRPSREHTARPSAYGTGGPAAQLGRLELSEPSPRR